MKITSFIYEDIILLKAVTFLFIHRCYQQMIFTCDGLHILFGDKRHGGSSMLAYLLIGKQHWSRQSSSHPQSHSSPSSTTPFPQIAAFGSRKKG